MSFMVEAVEQPGAGHRGDREVFCPEAEAELSALVAQGLSLDEIVAVTGRQAGGIKSRINRLGLKMGRS